MRTGSLIALLAVLGACGADSAPPRDKFEALPADAEVHLVAVSQPLYSGLNYQEVTDWNGLVKALRAKDGVGAHIRKLLPKDSDEVLNDDVEKGQIGNRLPAYVRRFAMHKLALVLSQSIRTQTFYDKDVFAEVELTKSLKELAALGDRRTVFQTERMNRELLSLVFPGFLAETPADYHTVYITVKPGKPVVLVTSANFQTRWVVNVEKGATVAGVIQYGNHAQELTGTDAPLVYRAGIRPNGKKGPVQGFNAYKQDDKEPSYKRIKGEVQDLTKKEFASFQGENKSGLEPFVVQPGAK